MLPPDEAQKHLIVGNGITDILALKSKAVATCLETRFLGTNDAT